MSMTKTKLFSMNSVNFRFILNVAILIIQITVIFKTVINCSVAQNIVAQFFFNSLTSNKNTLAFCTNTNGNITQWTDLRKDHNTSLSLKSSPKLELLVNQFNNATQEIVMTLKRFLHLTIMTFRKCITLKYLTKINCYPYSI